MYGSTVKKRAAKGFVRGIQGLAGKAADLRESGAARALILGLAASACASEGRVSEDVRLFSEDFQSGEALQWTPYAGSWDVQQTAGLSKQYAAPSKILNQSIAGSYRWTDYQVEARVTLRDDAGKVGLLGRVGGTHHYYELLLGRNGAEGKRSWFIRRRTDHVWDTLASGELEYELNVPYRLRFDLRGERLAGLISSDDGGTFTELGAVTDARYAAGKIGVASYFTSGSFDDVTVEGAAIALAVGPWGPIAELRDTTNTFVTGRPPGGWYVTAIHATLRPSDGSVVLTGFGRKAEASCSGTTGREVGETFVVAPSQIDALADGATLFVQPLNEQNRDQAHEVLYCAGHNTLADGRIFYTGGTRYPSTLPNTSPELGVNYARLYNPQTNSFTRISAPMKGGQSLTPGMKWYPTNALMPDGQVLTFGGFHWYGGGSGDQKNLSFELFDPKILDANPAADPFTVLTQHTEGNAETPPTRGYTNLFVLPKPVPASSAGGFARSVAVAGGVGRVFLFNHEPGPMGAQRLMARTNSRSPNPSLTEKAEGASGLMLPDGKLMFPNGGHDGVGAQRTYFYDPYADSWSTLDTGISRIYANALWLPNGTVLLVNGYVSEPGSVNDVTSPLGGPDGVRKPQIIDPFARTVTTEPAWPEPTGRGYHSFALLLKDGRVMIGGGKDGNHSTGCEKNELRIYSPPYLSAGPRPAITNVSSGQRLTVGGSSLTINYSGTVRATRGVALLAPPSVTHAFDSGQRYVPLTITAGPANGTLTVALPASINEAPPGDYLLHVVSDLGVPSVGVHVRLTPPAACVYPVTAGTDAYIEAEGSSRRAGPFQRVSDATRSSGAFMQVDPASGSTTSVPDEAKVMWYDLDVRTAGNFFLWTLANGPNTSSDSFYASVNGNADVVLDTLPANAWGWQRSATAFNLPVGKHTLKIKAREGGAKLDKLRLTTSTSTTAPTGLGSTAMTCGTAPIAALVVNDTAGGSDGIPNSTQWSVQPSFGGGAGQLAFGDRNYTIAALPAAAAHLAGKPWIRTAADSKFYTAITPPLATATVNGTFVFIAVDSRQPTTFLVNAGYTSQGYSLTVNEGTTPRTYNVWRRAVTPGSSVTFPTMTSTASPCYFAIIQ